MSTYFIRQFGFVGVAGYVEHVFTWRTKATYEDTEKYVSEQGQRAEASPTAFLAADALAPLRRDLEKWRGFATQLESMKVEADGWRLTAEVANKNADKIAEILALAEKEVASQPTL